MLATKSSPPGRRERKAAQRISKVRTYYLFLFRVFVSQITRLTMRKLVRIPLIISVCLLAATWAAANGVHPLFNLQSTAQSPFPSDRFTVRDAGQNTYQRI